VQQSKLEWPRCTDTHQNLNHLLEVDACKPEMRSSPLDTTDEEESELTLEPGGRYMTVARVAMDSFSVRGLVMLARFAGRVVCVRDAGVDEDRG